MILIKERELEAIDWGKMVGNTNCLIAFSDSSIMATPINAIIMGGVIFDIPHYFEINKKFNSFKEKWSLNELKLKKLSNKLIKPYAEELATMQFTAFITFIDKDCFQKKYISPDDPVAFAFELLIERFGMFAKRNDAFCLILHDEENIKALRERLDISKKYLIDEIFRRKRTEFTYILDTLATTSSHQSVGIQIADTIAEVGKILFRSYFSETGMKHHEIISIIMDKLDKKSNGELIGYGLKYYPENRFDKDEMKRYLQLIN